MSPSRFLASLLALALAPAAFAQRVSAFTAGELAGWQERSFKGNSHYRIAEIDGERALHASCKGGASVLYREQKIDLTKTPVLQWAWRVDDTFAAIDERSKGGDDYPARVYVVVDGGLLAWRTIAMNYVWASEQPKGSAWDSAFTGNAQMLALRSGPAEAGQWRQESRNVREDFRRFHGRDIEHIDGVAVMTDCDNTGGSAEAWFGDLRFVAE